jgi:RNA polymerase sigma-70 factor (ECF subfamily)
MTETAPEALVQRARQGDSEAFEELFRGFGGRVLGLCRHMLGSTEAAEDARSEVFLRASRRLDSYDAAQPFARWLLAVAGHYCIDVLRRRRLERRLFAPDGEDGAAVADGDAGTSPLSRVLLDERRHAVREAIARLPERHRVPLVLRYYAELGYDEIAAQLGVTRTHVATRIFRAKQELRRRLGAGPTE